jgi:S1-C subfamily serine protease
MRSQIPGAKASTVRRTAATIVVVGGAAFLSTAVWAAQAAGASARAAHAPPAAPATSIAPAQIDYAAMVERYGPAVVNISTAASSDSGDQADQAAAPPGLDTLDADDPIFALLRTMAAPPSSPASVPEPPKVVWGSGSGFIISADGIVVTTAHVVNRAEQVTVTLTDKRQFKADVLAVDPQSDIALLQMQHAAKLPSVRLGDSSRARVGERVLAIGAPDGPQNTVASGLVSVTPHALPSGGTFSLLETDIAGEPDNSGGPLLDGNGMAIGVDVQVYADAGPYRNMTLAIPIEAVLKLRAQLQEQGKLASGSLGVQLQDINPGLAAAFGLPHATGALVTDAAPASRGGAASGLKPGDVITHINGKALANQAALTEYVSALQPGSKVALTIVRNKKPMQLTTTIVSSTSERAGAAPPVQGSILDRLGLSVHALTDAERSTTGLTQGVVVDTATGAAVSAGIQAGDIVLSVNSEAVATPEALQRSLARGGKDVALLIQRDGARSFVSLAVR